MSQLSWTIAHLLIAVTCFSIAGALFILVRRKASGYPYSRTAWLLMATFAASGLFHLITIPYDGQGNALIEWSGLILAALAASMGILVVANILSGRERLLFSQLESLLQSRSAEVEALQTERHRLVDEAEASAMMLAQTTQRFETTLRKAPVFVSNQDERSSYTWVRNPPPGYDAADMLGKGDRDIFPPAIAEPLSALKAKTMATREHGRMEIEIAGQDNSRWYEIGVDPMIGGKDQIIGVTTAAIDITHRKRNEAQLKLLLRDVTHRAKNVLAVVNAIARQTASRTNTKDEFLDRFSARVQSLARAHDLLVNEDWHGVQMGELVRSQLSRFDKLVGTRITCEGPEVVLGPEATQNLALAIHELAHNAGRYGALSNDTGTVTITWTFTGSGGDRRFNVRWEEKGGPPVGESQRMGFGRTFIERAVGRTLDGSTKLTFQPTGVVCDLEIPGYHLLRHGKAEG